jgi:hypothetical protein
MSALESNSWIKSRMVFAIFRTVLLSTLLSVPFALSSQTILSEIAVAGTVNDIQVFPYGDSLLVTLQQKIRDNITQPQVFWVYNRKVTQCPPFFDSDDQVLAIAEYRTTPCLYIADGIGKKNSLLAISSEGTQTLLSSDDLDGRIAGVFHDDRITVVTINNRKNQLKVFEIDGLKVVSEKTFVTQYNIRGSIPVAIGENDWMSIEKGMSVAKLYKYSDKLSLVIDDNQFGTMESSTTLIEFSLDTGKTQEFRIPAKGMQLFRSCLYGDKLYRLCIFRDMLYLSTNNAYTGKLLAAEKIDNGAGFKKQTITSRSGNTMIRHDNTLHGMIRLAQTCVPSISIVYPPTDTTDAELMVGTHVQEQNIVAGTYPLVGAIGGAVIAVTLRSIAINKGQYHYFYARPNRNREFDFVADADSQSANAKIDHYELVQKEQYAMHFDVKDYLKIGDAAIGLYYSTKTNTISLVKFGIRNE